jgi:hypothetical protein
MFAVVFDVGHKIRYATCTGIQKDKDADYYLIITKTICKK